MSGISVIPPGFTAGMLKPQPAWLRFRTRASYGSGAPSVPGDFLSLPSGAAPPTTSTVFGLFTWGTNASAPYLAAYGRSALVWTYQGVASHRLNFVLPPWSGPAPLQIPPNPASIIGSLSELRLVGTLGWSGGDAAGGADIFSGFWFSDWNAFAIGAAGNPWPDIAANSYIGLIVNRLSGVTQIAVKRAGTVGRTIVAALPNLPANVAYTVDHRFYAATMTRNARYVARINGQIVAEFVFTGASSPVYANTNDGIAPALFGTYHDVGGSTRHEHILQLDVLAGPGANEFTVD